MLNVDKLPEFYIGYRARFRDRDDRMQKIRDAVNGNTLSTNPDDTDHGSVSPNLPQVALEDTAESAALMPTIRVHPMEPTSEAKAKAARMERIAASYLNRAGGQLFLTQAFLHLAAYGFFIPAAYMDAETGLPTAQLRDAVGAYPEADWKPGMTNRRCIFARDVYLTQLPVEYQAKLSQFESNNKSIIVGAQKKITLLEYFDEQETVIAAMYAKSIGGGISTTHVEYLPAELERFEHGYDLCPVVVGQRLTLDGEPRGQFDQVLAAMQAHDRLMAMAIDYADQAVYSDIWVVDALGEIPYGGGAIIQLGPNGKIGRVPPAVPSLSLFNELDQLLDTIHLGGRWPKSRPGEIDQAIASAKFLETSVGVMNTVLKTYHLIMKYTLEQLLNIMFKMDQKHGRERQVAIGVLRNQQFVEAYSPRDDIDLSYRVEVEYGLGLGRDPAQSAVLQIQYMQVGAVSKEFVQESIEGINDVDRERRRIDVEKFTDMMFGQIMQGVQGGTIPDKALVDMAKARMTGAGIFEIYEKYVLKPQEDAKASGITSGLDGSMQQPGAPPAAAGPGAGLTPPPAPNMPKAMGRLSIPMGGGSFAGTQSGG